MTVRPFKKDLEIYKGAAFDEPFEYYQDDGVTPIDLTGVSMRMQVRTSLDADDPVVELTTDGGQIMLTDAAAGRFRLFLTASETEDLAAMRDAVYDLEVVPVSGEDETYRLLMGKVDIIGDVTR